MFLLVPRISYAEEQPHMQAALQHLQEAAEALRQAEHDKGGHREKALDLTQQAINHVKAGMRFDTSHERKGEGMKKNDKQR
jgi:hypothetical protein